MSHFVKEGSEFQLREREWQSIPFLQSRRVECTRLAHIVGSAQRPAFDRRQRGGMYEVNSAGANGFCSYL